MAGKPTKGEIVPRAVTHRLRPVDLLVISLLVLLLSAESRAVEPSSSEREAAPLTKPNEDLPSESSVAPADARVIEMIRVTANPTLSIPMLSMAGLHSLRRCKCFLIPK